MVSDWSQVRNLGGELIQFFPDWHDLYYKTKLPHEWKGVWFRICSQFSKSSVGFMIHCRVGGSNVNLKRDSGGWITLRHAAREIQEYLDRSKNLDWRGELPVSAMLSELTTAKIEQFLFAYACESVEPRKHRIQFLLEVVERNDDYVRPYAIRFAYGHSTSHQDFLDTSRLGCPFSREMLSTISGFFHHTTKREK